MTIDEIMARLTPQEQQHVSPESVAAVLRVLSASIADTAGAKADNLQEIVRLCRLFMDDESGKYNAQSMMLRIFGLAIATPPAPSVADAAGASEKE